MQLRHPPRLQPFNLGHIQSYPRPQSKLTPNEATDGVTLQSHQRNSEGYLYSSNFNPMYFSFRGKGSDHDNHPSSLKRANTVNYGNRATFQLTHSQQPKTQCGQYDIVDVTQLYENVTSQLNNTTQATLPSPQRFIAEVTQPNTRRSRSLWRSIICCCCRPSTLPEAEPSISNVHRVVSAISETPPQQMTVHFNKGDPKLFADLRLNLNKSNKTDSDEDATTLEFTSDRVVKYIKANEEEKAEQICKLLIKLKDLDTLPKLLYLNSQQTHDDIEHNRHWLELFLRLAGFSTKSYSQPPSILPAFTRIQLSAALKKNIFGTQQEKYGEFVNEFFEEQQIDHLLTKQQLHKKELDKKELDKKEVYDV